jgi:elongation factor Ts
MSEISAADVKKLRDRTGISFAKCKEALVQAAGDMEKAVEIIRIGNKDAQNKVAGREAGEGRIGVFIDPATKAGALVEMRCESAPVAKSEQFVTLANELARQVALKGAAGVEELLAQPFLDDPKKTVQERISEVIGLIRENMKPVRLARLSGGLMGSYVHHDGSVGVLVQAEGEKAEPQILRDVAMHVTAKQPLAATRESLTRATIDKEMEIARAQATEQGKGKPANIIERIAEGKMRTFFAEKVLAEQPFVKDETKTVGDLLKGAGLKLVTFVRLKVGEVPA